jgi:hypothetical protein
MSRSSFIGRWHNPPIGEFLKIDGVRLHYIIRGDPSAPPLVMLHGNGTTLQDLTLSGLVDAAANKFRVICFEAILPPCGRCKAGLSLPAEAEGWPAIYVTIELAEAQQNHGIAVDLQTTNRSG